MSNDVVLVTGAASGIGRASLGTLRGAGYRVIAADLSAAALAGLADADETHVLDITDRTAVLKLADTFKERSLRLHALVVSAGVHSSHPVADLPDAVIDGVMDVNFNAHVKLVRDFLPLMKEQGRIIGVSSIGATVGLPMSSIYSASKGALELFYEALSTELAHRRIYPVIIQPGNVNTGFNETGNTFAGSDDAELSQGYARFVAMIDSSKGMPPEAVAKTIATAATAARPKLCYVVGMNALKAYWARRLLGRTGAVLLLRRYFGFKG